jgi:seryl-tRNA synthetase
MANTRNRTLEPAQRQELERIAGMIRRGESSPTIDQAWRAFIEKSLDKPRLADRVKSFGEIWPALQEDLDVVQSQIVDDLQRQIDQIAYRSSRRNQIQQEIDRTRQLAGDYIAKLEEELNNLGDDAQLANVDLQNMLQKQQQTLQMISNISKMLHDTAMAVIRKIGG